MAPSRRHSPVRRRGAPRPPGGPPARTLQDLVDRADIEDLLVRYARACDTRDWTLYRSIFTADALIDYTAAYGIRGRLPKVSAWIAELMDRPFLRKTQHLITNLVITVDGDEATAHADYINPDVIADDAGGDVLLLNGGQYTVTLRRTPKGWRMTRLVAAINFSHRGQLEHFQIPLEPSAPKGGARK